MSNLSTFTRALIAATTIIVLAPYTSAWAGDHAGGPRILVTGTGRADIAPDMAVLSLMVTREADTARAALDSSSSAIREVIAALKSEAVAERDIQTSNFSIQPRYSRQRPNQAGIQEPPRIVGYTVRNGLSVRVRDLTTLGAILDKSVTLGVNQGGNITFTNKDPSAAIEEARTRAVKQAMAKVHTLAQAAGVKVGRVLEISEQSSNPRPRPMAVAEMSMMRSASPVPVAAGENTYNVTVNISIAIDQ